MNWKKTACIGLGVMAFAGMSQRLAAEIPVTINAGVAYWMFSSDTALEDTSTPWVSLEYAFGEKWAAELFYATDDTEFKSGPSADISTWQVDALRYGSTSMGDRIKLRPYFAVGAGQIDIEGGTVDALDTTVNGGVGLRWMFGDRFGLRTEARVVHNIDENNSDLLFSVGLNYYLGDVEPKAVVAAAPVDSDGDGVFDDKDQCPDTPAGTRVDSVGCKLLVSKVESIRLKVSFAHDSAVVQEQYFADLGELAEFLQRFEDMHVTVEGHTDSSGPEKYNQQLSQRRAQAVVDLLVNEHGIASGRLDAVGYGESRPIASNDTKEGREKNRRVMATLEVEYSE